MAKKYNGWVNYPTWAVYTWLSSTENSYNFWHETAQEIYTASKYNGNAEWKISERARYYFENFLKQWAECNEPLIKGMDLDLYNWAIGHVEWLEIANAFLEEVEGYETTGKVLLTTTDDWQPATDSDEGAN